MMKRIIAAITVLASAFSCRIEEVPRTRMALSVTAADSPSSEGITGLKLFIFNESGTLEGTYSASFERPQTTYSRSVSVKTGAKSIFVIADADPGEVSSVGELLGKRIGMQDCDFPEGRIPMGGFAGEVIVDSDSPASCSIDLLRFPARIRIGEITNRLGCGISDISFRLSNAVGCCAVSGDPDGESLWFNKIYSLGSDIDAPEDIVLHGTIGAGGSRRVDGILYCFPNHTGGDTYSGSSFTPRKTRLVMACTIGGIRYYYPVTFDSIERNTSYSVNLVIRKLGSSDPDTPLSGQEMSISIVPIPWDGPYYNQETL